MQIIAICDNLHAVYLYITTAREENHCRLLAMSVVTVTLQTLHTVCR